MVTKIGKRGAPADKAGNLGGLEKTRSKVFVKQKCPPELMVGRGERGGRPGVDFLLGGGCKRNGAI